MKVKLRPLKQLINEGWRVNQSDDGAMMFIYWPGSTGSFCAVSTEMITVPHLVVEGPHIPSTVVEFLNGALEVVPEDP